MNNYKEELIENAIKRDPALRSREEAAIFSPALEPYYTIGLPVNFFLMEIYMKLWNLPINPGWKQELKYILEQK